MRRPTELSGQILFGLLAIGLVATGCDQAPAAPSSDAAFAGQPLAAAASHDKTNLRIPFDATFFIPCANGGDGEFVDVSTTLHLMIQMTESNSGNLSITFHAQPQGATGTGQTTGTTYHSGGVTHETATLRADGLPFEFTFVDRAIFATQGQGQGHTFIFSQIVHVTINDNGDVTADVLRASAECK